MQEYDLTLKLLFQSRPTRTLWDLTGTNIRSWLNVEFQKFQTPRVDLLGETTEGELLQIELQSTNDPSMALRMAEYSLAIFRQHKRFPRQIVVYVGAKPMAMSCILSRPHLFRFELVDIREIDGDRLLASREVSDNVIGILGRVADSRGALRRLVNRIAKMRPDDRATYLNALLVVAGLRGLEPLVEREAKNVPVLINILDNKVLGREYKRGLDEGLEKGLQRGQTILVRRQLKRRFGPIPAWVEQRLKKATTDQLEAWAVKLLEAKSLKELLG